MSQSGSPRWMSWRSLRWNSEMEQLGSIVQFCDRMLQFLCDSSTSDEFLKQLLPEMATEFSAQRICLWQRTPKWKLLTELGRAGSDEPDLRQFEEILDRGESSFNAQGTVPSLMVPLEMGAGNSLVLVMEGNRVDSSMLESSVACGRFLSHCLQLINSGDSLGDEIFQLQKMLEVVSRLPMIHETQKLLEYLAESATELVDCDRASIFVWSKESSEITACPALGVEGNTLRLPDNVGIVGEVIHSGRTIRVDDVSHDERFHGKVDKTSGYQTRNLLCVPLRGSDNEIIGAFEVINKNEGLFTAADEQFLLRIAPHAAAAIVNTKEHETLTRSRANLEEQVTRGVRLIGESPAIEALRNTVDRLAATDLPVLILGESGTGKEVVSTSLHYLGPRAKHPFVAVNCAAIAETLLESELFGHIKGAFTDASENRKGKFELAEGGTIFLDEIGDMSLGGQAKLLRVLEQKVVTPVGGSQNIPINVRIVAATNANLLESVREKKFREDLYYRLSVVTQHLPPLRDRPEDILPLAQFFLKQFSVQARRPELRLSSEARLRMQSHSWPGNIRELRNLMERVAFLANGDQVEAEDLAFILSPDESLQNEPFLELGLNDATSSFQREFIRKSVKRVNGNMSEAARLMGLHRSNLYRKMRHLDMNEVGGEQ
ncbi:sigma-54 interaction domain-containing protein [Polystyrenella longa]|nr:sigma-54-dependent Fis family transcriptional regulator [Polystyrenella longa]